MPATEIEFTQENKLIPRDNNIDTIWVRHNFTSDGDEEFEIHEALCGFPHAGKRLKLSIRETRKLRNALTALLGE